MKKIHSYALLLLAVFALAACDSYDEGSKQFDNVVYLDVSKTSEVQLATFNNITPEVEKPLQATLAYPADADVSVAIAVDPTLVEAYNARFGTAWKMLDAKYYELSDESLTIPAGKTVSEVVTLRFRDLMGEGEEQNGALPIDETYLVPVRIAAASIGQLSGADVAYYVVKRSSAITVAAQLTDNWIEFPTLDKALDNSLVFNGLTAATYEALIYIDDFAKATSLGNPVSISSVMGVEQYLLLRIGDTNFERRQLQFDGSGKGPAFGKFPERDVTKNLDAGRWYHVACTYDQETCIARIYVDGKLQSEGKDMGVAGNKERIDLARRALYDLWASAAEADKQKYVDKGYDKMGEEYQFLIGKSYDDDRPLNGKIAEARVWSVARTPEQIWECMYEVPNPKDDPTLIGYWKFNDAKGNTVKDYSRYGNDGVAKRDIIWPQGIEIPVINKTEE